MVLREKKVWDRLFFSTTPRKLKTQGKNSRFRQIHLVELPKTGPISKPVITTNIPFPSYMQHWCMGLMAKKLCINIPFHFAGCAFWYMYWIFRTSDNLTMHYNSLRKQIVNLILCLLPNHKSTCRWLKCRWIFTSFTLTVESLVVYHPRWHLDMHQPSIYMSLKSHTTCTPHYNKSNAHIID